MTITTTNALQSQLEELQQESNDIIQQRDNGDMPHPEATHILCLIAAEVTETANKLRQAGVLL